LDHNESSVESDQGFYDSFLFTGRSSGLFDDRKSRMDSSPASDRSGKYFWSEVDSVGRDTAHLSAKRLPTGRGPLSTGMVGVDNAG